MSIDPVSALRDGDPGALEQFYRDHSEQILAWAIRLGGPNIDPEDTAHEVFAIALRKIHTFRGESKLSTWLFAITRNVVANARRKAAIWRFVGFGGEMDVLPADRMLADEEIQRLQRRRMVQRALETLKQGQREVLVLMDMEGRTAPDVGEMLGVPPGTVYSRLHYARKAFKSALNREELKSEGTMAARQRARR